MSLNKGIKYRKEHRKRYYKSGKYDKSCRPHGGCAYCLANRMHQKRVADERAKQMMKEDV